MPNDTDVFISYAHADQDWVRVLAENLHQSGLNVFFDEWDIGAGDVLVHKLDAGILTTRNGVIVVSPTALTRPWVREEYAAMMTRAVAGKQRLIPVLLKDAEMPPLMASRVWVDFRTADGPVYLQRVQELVRALKGERPTRPPRTGELKPPPGTGFVAEGNIPLRLRIAAGEATLSGGESGDVREPTARLDDGLKHLLWEQQRALHRAGTLVLRDADRHGPGPESVLADLGQRLGQAFLPPKVAATLEVEIARAVRHNASLDLALEVADDALADLPWETLRLPSDAGTPLALHPRIDLYRRVPLDGPSPAISIPGPLRILVAIGSPEAQNARGELLDMEAELKIILDAIEPARRTGRAMARILERGSVEAIREALEHQRYHVLYISCHAAPGRLLLEDADGREDEVTAERFWREALPANRGVPLIVLAGGATAREGSAGAGDDEERLPSLARELVARGVPGVIAMQAPVTDPYATDLAGALFQALATWQVPKSLHALAGARRRLEQKRLQDTSPRPMPPEWPTPTLYAAKPPLPLYDPTAPFEELPPPAEPVLDRGVVVRRVGDFVGRRREERLTLRALRSNDCAGVVLHGIGGVGKSTLAAQVLHRLAQDGWLLASLSKPADPHQVLEELGDRLLDLCLTEKRDERDPLRQVANAIREPKLPWEQRLGLLVRHVFAQMPLVFLFDNFEDNLDADRRPRDDLADLLARWIEQPGKSRLLFTCRYPFTLPDDAEDRLEPLHLGPLSPGETRKLVLRLDGLAKLQPDELQRAYEEVGGHPRALEYLDALLRGGHARFPQVERRLKAALKARNIDDPSKWRADTAGGLDKALAEAATLAADDVLLDELLRQLEPVPLARKLLIGASVYRVPVDRTGLAWQVGEIVERPDDPERQARMERVQKALAETRASGQKPEPAALGLSEADVAQYVHDLQEVTAPPIAEPEGFPEAVALLEALSLLPPVQYADDEAARHVVHRWTARALAQRTPLDELAAAHRRAADYWDWRVQGLPQPREQDVEDLLEARHHYHAAGDLSQAVAVHEHVCLQLDTWGAWQREERLCREVLDWVPERSPDAAKSLHQLGIIAQARGDHDRALDWYQKSLAIKEALGDRAGMASSYGQLGLVARDRGDHERALEWSRKALEICEALGDRAGIARAVSQIGTLYTEQGEAEAAVPFNLRSLAIRLEIGSPEARIDLHWLSRQREALGAERFRRVLAEHLSEADAARVIEWLDQYAAGATKG